MNPDLGAYEYGNTDGSSDWKAGIGVKMYYPNNELPSAIVIKNLMNSTITVYPNPASQILNFKNIEIGSKVLISNINGAVVMEQVLTDPQIDISMLSRGIYILKIANNNQHESNFKIIKI